VMKNGVTYYLARSQSSPGMLDSKMCEKVLKVRSQTTIDDTLDVLVKAMSHEKSLSPFEFPSLRSPQHHAQISIIPEDNLQRQVVRALKRSPAEFGTLQSILFRSDDEWASIARDLRLSHADAKRCVLQHLQSHLPPLDRAGFWMAVGSRQRPIDRGRSIQFAADRANKPKRSGTEMHSDFMDGVRTSARREREIGGDMPPEENLSLARTTFANQSLGIVMQSRSSAPDSPYGKHWKRFNGTSPDFLPTQSFKPLYSRGLTGTLKPFDVRRQCVQFPSPAESDADGARWT